MQKKQNTLSRYVYADISKDNSFESHQKPILRSREIRIKTFPISLQFDRRLVSTTAEMPAKFQSVMIIITPNPIVSRLCQIWRKDVSPLSEQRPWIEVTYIYMYIYIYIC